METTITTETTTDPDPSTKRPSDSALQFLWLLRAIHLKRGAEGLLDLAEHYELEADPLYADVARMLRAIGESDPSNDRWEETFRFAYTAPEILDLDRSEEVV